MMQGEASGLLVSKLVVCEEGWKIVGDFVRDEMQGERFGLGGGDAVVEVLSKSKG